jgi:transglutaminase-like putative cysteine protease
MVIILILYSFSHKILKDSIYEKYFLDGTSEKYEEIYIKIEDEKGAFEWNQISIYYTPYYNTSDFKFVEIKRKDGEIIKIPLENIKDELAPPELGGTIFWGTRKKILQLPKLNIGDVIHYGVFYKGGNWLGPQGEIIYRTPFPGYFNTIEIFEDYVPIKRKIYVIEELKEKPIRFKIFNGKINYKREKIDGKIVHVFWCDSIPPAKREYLSGSKYDYLKKIIITNIPSWIDISKHEYFLSEESIQPKDYIKVFTDSILKDAKSDSEKIYKLFYFVSDKIRYLGLVETDVEGYKPHKAEIVLKHMEGVCKDKAGLLVSLLRAAGFKAYYAITGAGIRMEDFPSDQANHALVALEQKPFKYIYLDPTIGSGGKNLLPAYEEGQEILVARKEGDILRKIPFSKTEEKGIDVFIEENIFKNEIKGKLKINTKKGFDQFFRGIFRDKEYKDLKKFLKNYFSFLKGFEIDTILFMDTYDYSKYFEFEINFKRDFEFLKIDEYLLFKPILFYKEFIEKFLWEIDFIEKERKYPFVFNFTKKINIKEKINSEDFEIIALSKNEKFKGKRVNFEIEGQKDEITLSISINKKEFKGKEYDEVYRLKNEIERSFKKWVILKI